MRRRPWPIVLLALFQIFVEPWSNIFVNAWLSRITPTQYVMWFVNHHDWMSLVYLLILPPLMGITIYAMKLWSYPVFIGAATWMLYENFRGVQVGMHSSFLMPLLLYAGNVGFVSYFLLPAVQKPFLNKKMRWWESATRYLVDFPGKIDTGTAKVDCRILDFSEGGVFATCRDSLSLGQPVSLHFEASNQDVIELRALPVYCRRDGEWIVGYGFHFVDLEASHKKHLHELARTLERSDAPIRGGKVNNLEDLKKWWDRLIHTGKGLVPEPESAGMSKTSKPQAEKTD